MRRVPKLRVEGSSPFARLASTHETGPISRGALDFGSRIRGTYPTVPRLKDVPAIARAALGDPAWFGKRVAQRVMKGHAVGRQTPTDRDLESAQAWARRLAALHPQVRSAWLVGSRGRGTARRGSDFDFVVATDSQVDGLPLMSWCDYGWLGGVAVEVLFVASADFSGDELATIGSTAVLVYGRG